ncbi:UDP-glycosyltransferase 83A1 [Linum perenne]
MLSRVRLVGVPDGLLSELDRNDPVKQIDSQARVMPAKLRSLVDVINVDEMVVCMVADTSLAWAFSEARAIGIKTAAFSPVSAANLALVLHMPTLGFEQTNSPVQLGDGVLNWEIKDLPWSSPGFPEEVLKTVFQCCANVAASLPSFDYLLVNSFEELEPSACRLIPNIYPIGPLFTKEECCFRGSMWAEDRSCLEWLDRQDRGSVVYVAFGSIATIQTQLQFDELALGLELTGRPFLWVVRPDHGRSEFLDGFLKRVGDRGKIVEWANQEKVLSHPSIACFLSHCGWNSTLDGLVAGVPFLCWPFCFDQFHNSKCISETWKIGLELKPDDASMITRMEISRKVDELLSDETIESNSMKLREMALNISSDYFTYNYRAYVWAPYGHFWRSIRRLIVTKIFSTKTLRRSALVREEEVRSLLRRLQRFLLSLLTVNVMMRLAVGRRCVEEEEGDTKEEKVKFREFKDRFFPGLGMNICDFDLFLRKIGYGWRMEKHMLKMRKKRDDYLQGLVDEVVNKRMGSHKIGSKGADEVNSVAEIILSLRESDPRRARVQSNQLLNLMVKRPRARAGSGVDREGEWRRKSGRMEKKSFLFN